ncbi:MAG: phage tail tape measure protein [Desulfobulbus sp.]|nr:phage tail tape measure protein [Desulfobulbus sp.]
MAGGKAVGVSFVLGAALGSSVGSTFSTVDARVKNLRGRLKELQAVSTRAAALTTAEARLQAAQQANAAGPTEKTRRELTAAQTAYNSAERAAKKYNITVAGAAKAHAEATAAINKQTTALAAMEKFQANKAKRSELKGEIMGTVAGMLAAGAPLKLAADYETAMARVKRTAKFDPASFAAFKKQALALGGNLEDTGVIAAMGGKAVGQNELLHFTAVAKKMTKVFDVTAAEAGEALGGIRTHFKLNEAEADAYLDSLVHLANNMHGVSESDLLEFSHRTADIGKQYGVTREQIAALGATMSGMQVPARQMISATQGLFNTLGQARGAGKEAQAAFAKFGLRGKDIEQGFRKDAQGTMLKIFEHLQRYSGPMRMKLAKEIFGESEAVTVIKLVENLDQYKKAISLAGDATGSSGALMAAHKDITETANASLTRLKNKIVQVGTAMGESNLPVATWIANAGGGLLDTVFSLVTGFPTVTSAVVGFSTAMVGLSLATKAGKYAATMFSDGWTISKGVLNGLRPSVLASRAAIIGQTAATVAHKTVSLACAAGTKAMAAAQWVFNAAMTANPIGLVVVAVAALVGIMVALYQNSETVREVFNAVGEVFSVMWNGMVDSAAAAFDWLAEKFAWVSEAAGSVKGFFSDVGSFFGDSKEPEKPTAKPLRPVAPSMPASIPAPAAVPLPSAAAARGGAQQAQQPGGVPAVRSAPSGGSIAPQITFSLNFNGVPSKDVGETLVKAIKEKERDLTAYFEKMIADIASNQRRLSYGN